MGFNFPNAPALGDLYPPPTAGIPVYRWDGEKWLSATVDTTAPSPPFGSSMAYSGMQINGGFEVSQEKGVTFTTTPATYFCDGWSFNFTGPVVAQAGASLLPAALPGFTNWVQVLNTSAQAALGNGFTVIQQNIEGYRISRLGWGTANAQPITIAFWSLHNYTGLHSGTIRNSTAARSYAFTYTHNAAGVAQYNVVTIPGDTAGTWTADNTSGMLVVFAMASSAGGTFVAPSANTWVAGNYLTAPGQVNGASSASNIFRLTGVTVLPGTQAPTAAQSPNIMRPYGEELMTCRRYWQVAYYGAVRMYVQNIHRWMLPLVPPMRASAAITRTWGNNIGLQQDYFSADGWMLYLDMQYLSAGNGVIDLSGYKIIADARI